MILSKQDEFSNAQAITATASSTGQLDMGPAAYTGVSVGTDRGGQVAFAVDADFAAAGAATLTIAVRSADTADMVTGVMIHSQSAPIPVASLKKGVSMRALGVVLRVPENAKRYVDLVYTVATGPFTAGQLSARLAMGLPNSVGA